MDKEPDAGWFLIIRLLLGVSTIMERWLKEESEGSLNLPYLFIPIVADMLIKNELSPENARQTITIINEAYDTSLPTHEGINNFLSAGFIEGMERPDFPGVSAVYEQLRPELQNSYHDFFGAAPQR